MFTFSKEKVAFCQDCDRAAPARQKSRKLFFSASEKSAKLLTAVLVLFPLFAGGVIYLLWRPDSIILFRWIEWLGVYDHLQVARSAVRGVKLPYWLLYNYPNGAWTYAFTATLALIWADARPAKKVIYLLIPLFSGLLLEWGQFLSIYPGTYCRGDVIAHFVGAFWGYMVITTRRYFYGMQKAAFHRISHGPVSRSPHGLWSGDSGT